MGPAVEVHEMRVSDSGQRIDSTSFEDEPWDQQRIVAPSSPNQNTINSTMMMTGYTATQRRRVPAGGEEELLDDGDLPSLSNSKAHPVQPNVGRPAPSSNTTAEMERQKFWEQVEKDREEVALGLPNSGSKRRRGNPNSIVREEVGPHDEMAARRLIEMSSTSRIALKSIQREDRDEYDVSVPTVDSQLTDEEIEDEKQFESTFCAQTLSAIEDMCGGNLASASDEAKMKEKKISKSPSSEKSRSPVQSRFTYMIPKELNPSVRRDAETQQEHTAIEVEFVEPVRSPKSSVCSDTQSEISSKKKAYLNAIAKKAKESFRRKKGKDSLTDETKSSTTGNLEKDAQPCETVADTKEQNDQPEQEKAPKQESTEGLEDLDQDYNSFSAVEKRKFVKHINCGMTAKDATRLVIEERKLAKEEEEKSPKVAARLAFWKRAQHQQVQPARSSESDCSGVSTVDFADAIDDSADEKGYEENPGPDVPLRTFNGDGADFPFEKSGFNYYDAVRREQQSDDDVNEILGVKNLPKADSGIGPRLFLSGKMKGFSALDESVEENSNATLPVKAESHPETLQSPEIESDVAKKNIETSITPISRSIGLENVDQPGTSSDDKDPSPNVVEKMLLVPIKSKGYQKIASEPMTLPATESEAIATSEKAVEMNEEITTLNKLSLSTQAAVDMSAQDDDRNMDTYIDSTLNELYDGNLATVNDSMSVYTVGTNVTSGTNYTQSSRTRRPGAAKSRLALQKKFEEEMEKKRQGWLETIKAAALSTNRIWDAKHGWVDYEPSGTDRISEHLPDDKSTIRIDLDRSVISQKEEDNNHDINVSGDSPAPVAFPEEWERERKEMLGNHDDDLQSAVDATDAQTPAVKEIQKSSEINDPATNSDDDEHNALDGESVEESRPKGWIESMRIASAVLADQGKTWDPQHGWMVRNDKGDLVPFEIGFDERNDMLDSLLALTRAIKEPENQHHELSAPIESAQDHLSHSNDDFDNNSAPIENGSVDFNKPISPVVSVVKQKVGREDFDLFSEEGPRKNRSVQSETVESSLKESDNAELSREGLTGFVGTAETSRSNVSVISQENSYTSSVRRSVGPIDVDEVDETWDSEGEDLAIRTSYPTGTQTANPAQSSVGSAGSKKFPKLARSKRDTSPIHMDITSESSNIDMQASFAQSRTAAAEEMRSPNREKVDLFTQPNEKADCRTQLLLELESSPTPENTAKSDTSQSPGVKARLQEWENRIETSNSYDINDNDVEEKRVSPTKDQRDLGDAGWNAFIRKKIDAEKRVPLTKDQPGMGDTGWNAFITKKIDADSDVDKRVSATKDQPGLGDAGWNSFIRKKIDAESASTAGAAAAPEEVSRSQNVNEKSDKKDPKLFLEKEMKQSRIESDKSNQIDGSFLHDYKGRSAMRTGKQTNISSHDLNISDISPIRQREDTSDHEMDESVSDAYGPTSENRQPSSILKRLSECAAPMIPARMSPTSNVTGRFLPPTFCGRNGIDEPESIASSVHSTSSADRHTRSASFGDEKPKLRSSPKSRPKEVVPVSSSSVVSEDFGAKTAYLEALAMKAAVSKPRRSSSARRSTTGSSVVSTSSTIHSERWREFLEKKKAGTSSKSSHSDVSKAAEKYTSGKVEEIMNKMASRSKSVARSRDVHREYHSVVGDGSRAPSKATSVQAAEDLAAARVQAMMAALSPPQTEEGEI